MIQPTSFEEIATYVQTEKTVFLFTTTWCGDCQFIQPIMPEIEAQFPDFRFVEIDRDVYEELSNVWNIFGIPSLVVTERGNELGRLVNKKRKTKEELIQFLNEL